MSLLPCIPISEIINTHKHQLEHDENHLVNIEFKCVNIDDSITNYLIKPKEFLKSCLESEKRLIELYRKVQKNDHITTLQSSARIAKYLQLPIRTPTIQESIQQMLDMKKILSTYDQICKMFTNLINLQTFKLIEKQDKIRLVCDTSPRPRSTCKQIHYKSKDLFQGNEFTSITDDTILRAYFFDPIRGSRIAGFDILGSQTLADLKDSFICTRNQIFCNSNMSGSCILLNGILYPDTRNPNSHKYDKELMDYLIRYNPQLLKSNITIPQHKAILNNMDIPINKNGVYLHNGDCEHRFMFTSIRMASKNDCTIKNVYPLCIYKPITRIEMCEICKKKPCKSLVFNCKLLIKNPMYLCNICLQNFIYNEDKLVDPGTKIYNLEN